MNLFRCALVAAAVALAASEVIARNLEPSTIYKSNSSTSTLSSSAAGFDNPPALGAYFDPNNFADPALWERYRAKGDSLMCAMRGSDQFAGTYLNDDRSPPSAASRWRGDFAQDMAKWGWFDVSGSAGNVEGEMYNDGGNYPLENAMNALGLSAYPDDEDADIRGHNKCFWVSHGDLTATDASHNTIQPSDQYYVADGTQYRCTDAAYAFTMNKVDGAIFGNYLDSPAHKANETWNRPPLPSELPALHSYSDFLWAFWARDNPNPRNIRIYGATNVKNPETVQLLASAFSATNQRLRPWPGASWTTDTDEGKALLGGPIGASIAYFLMQHKAELGRKIVTRVTVVKTEGKEDSFPQFFFHIADYTSPAGNGGGSVQDGLGAEKEMKRGLREEDVVVKRSKDGKSMLRAHVFRV